MKKTTCRGSAWSPLLSTTRQKGARPRTVTPARPSSTPMSSRARSAARSRASRLASIAPTRRGSRALALVNPVSVNASDTAPARLLAVVVVDAADKQLTIPDPQ